MNWLLTRGQMADKWRANGFQMVSKWFPNGFQMVFKWFSNGFQMVFVLFVLQMSRPEIGLHLGAKYCRSLVEQIQFL